MMKNQRAQFPATQAKPSVTTCQLFTTSSSKHTTMPLIMSLKLLGQ